MLKLGLCRGRHELPVTDYIFDEVKNMFDFKQLEDQVCMKLIGCKKLTLYVTGLTVALTTVINVCCQEGIELTLMHYNSNSGEYVPQEIYTREDCDLTAEYGGYSRRN